MDEYTSQEKREISEWKEAGQAHVTFDAQRIVVRPVFPVSPAGFIGPYNSNRPHFVSGRIRGIIPKLTNQKGYDEYSSSSLY